MPLLTDRCLTVHHVHMTTPATPPPTPRAVRANGDRLRLAGTAELSIELGVPTTNISTWMTRRDVNGFPLPLAQLGMGGVYDLDEVKEWHDRFTGRPPRGRRTRTAETPAEVPA